MEVYADDETERQQTYLFKTKLDNAISKIMQIEVDWFFSNDKENHINDTSQKERP